MQCTHKTRYRVVGPITGKRNGLRLPVQFVTGPDRSCSVAITSRVKFWASVRRNRLMTGLDIAAM